MRDLCIELSGLVCAFALSVIIIIIIIIIISTTNMIITIHRLGT